MSSILNDNPAAIALLMESDIDKLRMRDIQSGRFTLDLLGGRPIVQAAADDEPYVTKGMTGVSVTGDSDKILVIIVDGQDELTPVVSTAGIWNEVGTFTDTESLKKATTVAKETPSDDNLMKLIEGLGVKLTATAIDGGIGGNIPYTPAIVVVVDDKVFGRSWRVVINGKVVKGKTAEELGEVIDNKVPTLPPEQCGYYDELVDRGLLVSKCDDGMITAIYPPGKWKCLYLIDQDGWFILEMGTDKRIDAGTGFGELLQYINEKTGHQGI